jgi:DUF438 domain-containing protein
MKMNDPKRR